MKPICGKCNLFMPMAKAGEYFEERMPGPNGAKRRELPGTVTQEEFIQLHRGRVEPGELEGWQPYKLWVGDLHECRGCGAQVIVGVPPKPIAEHFESRYQEVVNWYGGALRHIDDC